MAPLGNVITVKEASDKMNIAEQTMRKLLINHGLDCQKIGNQWMTTGDSLAQILNIRPASNTNVNDFIRPNSSIPSIKAMSFFSGAMGLDIGMKNAGIDSILACEFEKHCRNTIVANNPNIGLIGDIQNYSVDEIFKFANIGRKEQIDVIFGGPPCQAFSTAGTRQAFGDKRGNIFLKFLDIIEEIKPKYVVIENVRGLLSATLNFECSYKNSIYDFSKIPSDTKGGALLLIINRLRDAGYSISFNLYNAANYGAPQIRERVVIIGYLGKEKVPYLEPTHAENGEFGLLPWRTLGEVLKGMNQDKMHSLEFPEKRLRYYRLLKEGENWRNLSVEMQKEAMGKSYYLGGGKTG
ncbi:MAG: DNA (cytosine-5-)-methyltransferase, partial [Candidatus Cloacimonetes bacterium]|nr:DNA (cytosine-5-)-methyltransferase [Candidatus Cloacimonadota bacterium]